MRATATPEAALALVAAAGAAGYRRRGRLRAAATEVNSLGAATGTAAWGVAAAFGEALAELPEARRASLRAVFPELRPDAEGVRVLYDEPPVLLIEDLLSKKECDDIIEAMRMENGEHPRRLGQSSLALPEWMAPAVKLCKGLPVLDWLGNPTVRWTYRARGLLPGVIARARERTGLDIVGGMANVKHYREGEWLPQHIDYNRATLMVYLNDVGVGGETLFPTCGGMAVPPLRGSALIWPNQPSLPHAGSPVVEGEKWILFYNWPAAVSWESEIEMN